jgi:hypothetical protein
MTIDLLEEITVRKYLELFSMVQNVKPEEVTISCRVSVLLAYICGECGICMPDGEYGRVAMDTATLDAEKGLIITDDEGDRWRIRFTAEPVKGD